jgi:beta-lactamase class A
MKQSRKNKQSSMPYRPVPPAYMPAPRAPMPRLRVAPTPAPTRPRFFSAGRLGILVLIIVVGYVGFHIWPNKHQVVHATPKPSLPVVTTTKISAYQQSINTILAHYSSEDIAVQAIDLDNNQTQTFGVNAAFTAGSTAKLLTAVAYFHALERGDISPNATINGEDATAAMKAMIVDSDDDAWAGFNEALTHGYLAQYASDIGWHDYDVDINTMPADDIATLLAKLGKGQLLNKAHTAELLGFMGHANYRNYIVAAVPSGYQVYHKVGLVDDEVHDASIISKDGRSVVLVIFSKGNSDYDLTTRANMMHAITQATLSTYF